MFVPGFSENDAPASGDLVVGVRDGGVRFGTRAELIDVTDVHLIGHLDGAPVWAGSIITDGRPWIEADGLRPWTEVENRYGQVAARAVYSVQWRITHRFCGECGGPLIDCPGFPTRRCPRCETRPFVAQALTPAVVVAVTSADRILLARHSYGLGASMWALIAGMVEATETLEDAVAREVREEVGLEITKVRYVLSKGFSLDHPGTLMAGFTAACAPEAEPRTDGVELTEARWFTRDQFAALPPEALPPPYAFAWPLLNTWRMTA